MRSAGVSHGVRLSMSATVSRAGGAPGAAPYRNLATAPRSAFAPAP